MGDKGDEGDKGDWGDKGKIDLVQMLVSVGIFCQKPSFSNKTIFLGKGLLNKHFHYPSRLYQVKNIFI